MRETDITRQKHLPASLVTHIGAEPLNRRDLLLAAGGTAAALLLSGCGGGGTGSVTKLSTFTVTPDRAAPGTMVTLTGIQAIAGGSVDVRFGGVPAIVHAQDSTGLQVLVPPFIAPGAMTAAPPAAPVTVTVKVGSRTVKSANQFTVAPLPSAPGAAATVLTSIANTMTFFQSFFQDGMVSVFYNRADPTSSPLDAGGAIQGAAFCAVAAGIFASKDTPYSLLNHLSSLPSQGAAGAAMASLIDSMMAQGPYAAIMDDLAQTMFTAIATVAPTAVTTRGASAAVPHGNQTREIPTAYTFTNNVVDWSQVSAAQNIIIQLQMQKYLSAIANSTTSNFIQMAATIGFLVVQALELAVSGPLAPVTLSITSLAIDIGIKFMAIIASMLPSQITDFYVVINNQTRRDNQPAVNIKIDVPTPMRAEVVVKSAGGVSFTALGVAASISALVENYVPGLRVLLKGNPGVLKAQADLMLSLGDGVWQLATNGQDPPPQFSITSGTLNFPAVKYKPVDINSNRVITAAPLMPDLCTIGVDGANAYYLKGVKAGTADYLCFMDPKALVSGLPSLKDIAQEKWHVKGYVTIAGGSVQLGIS